MHMDKVCERLYLDRLCIYASTCCRRGGAQNQQTNLDFCLRAEALLGNAQGLWRLR
jgi:hypothetical protein